MNPGPIQLFTLPYVIIINYIFIYYVPISIDLYYCLMHLSFKSYRKQKRNNKPKTQY